MALGRDHCRDQRHGCSLFCRAGRQRGSWGVWIKQREMLQEDLHLHLRWQGPDGLWRGASPGVDADQLLGSHSENRGARKCRQSEELRWT